MLENAKLISVKFEFLKIFQKRRGAENDVTLLYQALLKRGFQVFLYSDMTSNETTQVLKMIQTDKSFGKFSMFGLAISSHGDEGDLIYNYDKYRPVSDYVNAAKNNPALHQKPKVFHAQKFRYF